MAKRDDYEQKTEALLLPIMERNGFELVDVEYVKEGARQILRVTIDRAEGVDIDHCEAVHRAIDPILDEADPIPVAYYLEVSSPGIERDLKTDMHINACEGWDVEVRLYAPVDNAKVFRGKLMEMGEGGEIRIDMNGEVREFARAAVAKIQTYFEF